MLVVVVVVVAGIRMMDVQRLCRHADLCQIIQCPPKVSWFRQAGNDPGSTVGILNRLGGGILESVVRRNQSLTGRSALVFRRQCHVRYIVRNDGL